MHDSAPSASAPSKSKQVAAKEKEVLEGKEQGGHVSSERAFADYVFGSMILHFFCVNFIN
jgi:oligosaccharyltransferase complex subunit epsilon